MHPLELIGLAVDRDRYADDAASVVIGAEHSVAELFSRPKDVKAWFVHSHLNGRNTVTISVYSQTSLPRRASSRIRFLIFTSPSGRRAYIIT